MLAGNMLAFETIRKAGGIEGRTGFLYQGCGRDCLYEGVTVGCSSFARAWSKQTGASHIGVRGSLCTGIAGRKDVASPNPAHRPKWFRLFCCELIP